MKKIIGITILGTAFLFSTAHASDNRMGIREWAKAQEKKEAQMAGIVAMPTKDKKAQEMKKDEKKEEKK